MSFHLSILVEVKGMVQTKRHRPLKWREREGSVEFRAVDIGIASKEVCHEEGRTSRHWCDIIYLIPILFM